jgi:hypothetical protein
MTIMVHIPCIRQPKRGDEWETRAGHLLMKYKRGTMTNNAALELQMLMHALSQE